MSTVSTSPATRATTPGTVSVPTLLPAGMEGRTLGGVNIETPFLRRSKMMADPTGAVPHAGQTPSMVKSLVTMKGWMPELTAMVPGMDMASIDVAPSAPGGPGGPGIGSPKRTPATFGDDTPEDDNRMSLVSVPSGLLLGRSGI